VIPAGSLYRIRVHGTVTVSPNPAHQAAYPNNPDYSASGAYGPGGIASFGQLLVIMQLHNTDGSGVSTVSLSNVQTGIGARDTASTQILSTAKAAELWVGRVGIAGSTNDNCCHWNIGDYALTASQTVTVEQLTNFVHLTASPAFVHSGQQVTFNVDNDDGTAQSVSGWTWARDPGTNANAPNGCFWAINPCTAAVFGSGTMTASTDYGAPSAHVTVYTNFTLDVDHGTVNIGDTATFTPKYDGIPGSATRWRWIPNATAPDSTACPNNTGPCKKAVMQAGTMWAYSAPSGGDSASKPVTVTIPDLTLYAHQQSGPVQRTVTFTPNWSDGRPVTVSAWSWTPDSTGGSTTACSGTPGVCEAPVSENGTMTVTSMLASVTKTASVHVTVVPCATGDTLLDTEAVRMGLSTIDVMSRSGSVQNRHEQGIYFFQNTLTGEVSALLNYTNYADNCSWADQPWPSAPANSVPIARGHSHPYDPAIDTLPAGVTCGKDKNGNPKTLKQPSVPHWGPSPADDAVAFSDGGPGFAIDADSIYRTDGPGLRHSWPRVLNGCSLLPPVRLNRRPEKPGLLPPSAITDTSKQASKGSTRRITP
jgi:hypothetical protein